MSRRPHQQDGTDPEGGPLARWSERKARSKRKEDVPVDEEPGDGGVEELPQKRDEDMPPLETLDGNSDVSEFFSPGVSDRLRTAALRKFFHSPVFNVVDGLDDYDDDFTSFRALGDIVTADMRHRVEMEARTRGDDAEPAPTSEQAGSVQPADAQPERDPDDVGSGAETAEAESLPDEDGKQPHGDDGA